MLQKYKLPIFPTTCSVQKVQSVQNFWNTRTFALSSFPQIFNIKSPKTNAFGDFIFLYLSSCRHFQENDTECAKMVQISNILEYTIVQNGSKKFRMVHYGPKWSRMVQNGPERSKIVHICVKLFQTSPDIYK